MEKSIDINTNKNNNNNDSITKSFIEYWDNVINIWLGQPVQDAIDVKRPLDSKKESYYKENFFVKIETEQKPFFNNHSFNKLLCPAHLPEPYWGDPDNCSIVVVDYNPAGGIDMNPHTYKGTLGGNQFPPNTIIDFVKNNSYSELAKEFPIWKKDLKNGMEWLCSYGGRKWWLQKKEWIKHLVEHLVGEDIDVEIIPPFAVELCGWHSPNWPDNTNAFENDLKDTIKTHFAQPLLAAIENSKSKLAVCIGAQFKPSILSTYLDLDGFKDITKDVFDDIPKDVIYDKTKDVNTNHLSQNGIISYPDNPSKNKNQDSSICVEINNNKPIKRYYRIYNIVNKNVNHIILNTFAPGGNHHPSKNFEEFENDLLEAIKDIVNVG